VGHRNLAIAAAAAPDLDKLAARAGTPAVAPARWLVGVHHPNWINPQQEAAHAFGCLWLG
jgi:hypothetical protein